MLDWLSNWFYMFTKFYFFLEEGFLKFYLIKKICNNFL